MQLSYSEYKSGRMELEGLRRVLDRLHLAQFQVYSVTTDRSRACGKLLQEYNIAEKTNILHAYDGWHLVKWLGNEIRKVYRFFSCYL